MERLLSPAIVQMAGKAVTVITTLMIALSVLVKIAELVLTVLIPTAAIVQPQL